MTILTSEQVKEFGALFSVEDHIMLREAAEQELIMATEFGLITDCRCPIVTVRGYETAHDDYYNEGESMYFQKWFDDEVRRRCAEVLGHEGMIPNHIERPIASRLIVEVLDELADA